MDYEQSFFFLVRRAKRFAARDRSARALPSLNLKKNKDHLQSRILQWTPESRSILQTTIMAACVAAGIILRACEKLREAAILTSLPNSPHGLAAPQSANLLLVLMIHRLFRLQS